MAEPTVNTGDCAWVLAATAFVLLMTPGLAFFYGGLVRAENILNTIMMSFISIGVVGIIWVLVGYSLAFGKGNWLIGDFTYWGLRDLDETVWEGTSIPGLLFATFQMTFAIIGAAIISGAVVERMRFGAYVTLVSFYCLLIHVPLAHWIWGGGWIQQMGALDFAGGTVVHIASGTSALVTALVLGKRANLEELVPHNMTLVVLGASLLWFGWTGFNGGSALAADYVAARAMTTTIAAASAALVMRVIVERATTGTASTLGALTGAVAGLVVITPAAGYVSPLGSLIIGAVGSLLCMGASSCLSRIHCLDDSLDAFGLHGVGGIVGAILTGLFAVEEGGLFYGGGWKLLGVNLAGALAGFAYTATMTAAIMLTLSRVMRIRVHDDAEELGLDFHHHGEGAYGVSPTKSYMNTPAKSYKTPSKSYTQDAGEASSSDDDEGVC